MVPHRFIYFSGALRNIIYCIIYNAEHAWVSRVGPLITFPYFCYTYICLLIRVILIENNQEKLSYDSLAVTLLDDSLKR